MGYPLTFAGVLLLPLVAIASGFAFWYLRDREGRLSARRRASLMGGASVGAVAVALIMFGAIPVVPWLVRNFLVSPAVVVIAFVFASGTALVAGDWFARAAGVTGLAWVVWLGLGTWANVLGPQGPEDWGYITVVFVVLYIGFVLVPFVVAIFGIDALVLWRRARRDARIVSTASTPSA